MEFTETEIKMFVGAEEIQALWAHSKRSSGDWYFHTELNCAYAVSDIDQEDSHCIWLPTQEQLQGMLPDFLEPKTTYLNQLLKAIIDNFYKLEKYSSWTIMWLAFVMHKKYHKVWNGEIWIKEV